MRAFFCCLSAFPPARRQLQQHFQRRFGLRQFQQFARQQQRELWRALRSSFTVISRRKPGFGANFTVGLKLMLQLILCRASRRGRKRDVLPFAAWRGNKYEPADRLFKRRRYAVLTLDGVKPAHEASARTFMQRRTAMSCTARAFCICINGWKRMRNA